MKKQILFTLLVTSSFLSAWQDDQIYHLRKEIPELKTPNFFQPEQISRLNKSTTQGVQEKELTLKQRVLKTRKNVTKVVNVGCIVASVVIFINKRIVK